MILTKLRDGGISEFLYTYDMGDNWEHHVEVLDLFAMPTGARLPVFIDGKWRAPPEDVGGAPGFEVFLDAMAHPNHEEHENLIDWYGKPFEPEDIEPEIVKIQLDRLARMRRPKNWPNIPNPTLAPGRNSSRETRRKPHGTSEATNRPPSYRLILP